jgi:hypothetical protein
MTTDAVTAGKRLYNMLDQMVNGTGEQVFPGAFGAVDMPPSFEDIYPDPYHNYFCKVEEDHVILVLHPKVKPAIEHNGVSNLVKYLWFGRQSDPVEAITPRKASDLIRNNHTRESPTESIAPIAIAGGVFASEAAADTLEARVQLLHDKLTKIEHERAQNQRLLLEKDLVICALNDKIRALEECVEKEMLNDLKSYKRKAMESVRSEERRAVAARTSALLTPTSAPTLGE